ncbi:prepilin peptidase [Necropsobacter massiliensis]|uniref:prepilin peptidase n=1 Tax=Necropsobacter massiliensis TaxID=1400001 RepID=UPI000693A68D|nr:A24 family peptidase [Necropsobacter massiliensis]
MSYFAGILCGIVVGSWAFHYISTFAEHTVMQVYRNYVQIFSQNPPHFCPRDATLQRKKCGAFYAYLIGFGALFLGCAVSFSPLSFALWIAAYCSLLFVIALIDWQYRLIPPALCQLLFVLALGGAYVRLTPLALEQSLLGAATGFSSFYLMYHLAKVGYRREALGRGDYWLMFGLGGFVPAQQLALTVFLACFGGLSYALYLRMRGTHVRLIPFAPFLCAGGGLGFIFYMGNFAEICHNNLHSICMFIPYSFGH